MEVSCRKIPEENQACQDQTLPSHRKRRQNQRQTKLTLIRTVIQRDHTATEDGGTPKPIHKYAIDYDKTSAAVDLGQSSGIEKHSKMEASSTIVFCFR